MIYGVIAFFSTHDAMTAQKFLKPLISIAILPTPRCITASCGISLRFSLDELPQLIQNLHLLTGYEIFCVGDDVCERIVL